MDSKSAIPTSTDEEPAPPAYTESIPFVPSVPVYQPYSSTSQYYSHQIQDQLQSITTQIKSLETQKSLLSHAKDEKILSLLTTQIQIYLSDFAKAGLHKGTLILVPAKGVEAENAVPVECDFKNPDEYDRVVRVKDKEADEYGEGYMFWRDEDMARRLARYLRPDKDLKNAELPPRKEQIKAAEQASQITSRGFWGRKKSSLVGAERPVLVEESRNLKVDPPVNSALAGTEDQVLMDVKAEEVVFRTENDFGIYETRRGWGIVLKLRVVLGR
jgi:hypothetical protein